MTPGPYSRLHSITECESLQADIKATAQNESAVHQQLEVKAAELAAQHSLAAQQATDLQSLRNEHEQSIAECEQLRADAQAAAERETALQSQSHERQTELIARGQELAGGLSPTKAVWLFVTCTAPHDPHEASDTQAAPLHRPSCSPH